MRTVVLVIHNVRSAHNVGSLLRTAEGLGVEKIYLTGYTPYPEAKNDNRLPHLRRRQSAQVHKTALGAESLIDWEQMSDINICLERLAADGYELVALEQTPAARRLDEFSGGRRLALIIGNEVTGLEPMVLKQVKYHVQIPMGGRKESFNVAIAAALALYHLINIDKPSA